MGSHGQSGGQVDRTELLAAYDAQLRTTSEMIGATDVAGLGPLWMATFPGGRGFVSYRDLDGADPRGIHSLVVGALDHFRETSGVTEVEWKTRSHDSADGLREALLEEGFDEGDPESVMVGEAASLVVDVDLPEGVSLRRVTTGPDIRAAADVLEVVFGDDSWAGMVPELGARITGGDPDVELWVAEIGDDIIGSGRLECIPDTQFAGIWGGGMLPGWRGRGIYRALTAQRARSALARGRRWIHSDSTPMSRPILERSGMVRVTGTTPWTWLSPAAAGRQSSSKT